MWASAIVVCTFVDICNNSSAKMNITRAVRKQCPDVVWWQFFVLTLSWNQLGDLAYQKTIQVNKTEEKPQKYPILFKYVIFKNYTWHSSKDLSRGLHIRTRLYGTDNHLIQMNRTCERWYLSSSTLLTFIASFSGGARRAFTSKIIPRDRQTFCSSLAGIGDTRDDWGN